MAALTRQDASGQTGATITPVAAAAGLSDTLVGGSGVHLYINNGGGSPITLTIITPETYRGLAVADVTQSITNGTWRLVPIPSYYNDPTTGTTTVSYTAITSVTVAAIQGSIQA